MTTTQIDNEFNNIAAIRSVMIDPVKLQLHSGVEGFDSPDHLVSTEKPVESHLEPSAESMSHRI
jgi:hypothetical protein